MAPGDIDGADGLVAAVDLTAGAGSGPLWGMASEDLNATLLAWPAGHEVAEHVNDERDVLVVVLGGDATIVIDGAVHGVGACAAILVPRGAARSIRAGAAGVRYLSVHVRRGPLQIAPLPPRG